MKKVYISLPISGLQIEIVKQNAQKAAEYLKKAGYEPVTPFEASPNENVSYAHHLGKDVEALLECDAVLFLKGWKYSKGCQLERYAAMIYNKEIILPWNISEDKEFEDIAGEPFRCGDIVTYEDVPTTIGVYLCDNKEKNDNGDRTFRVIFGKTKDEPYYRRDMIFHEKLRLVTTEVQEAFLSSIESYILSLKSDIKYYKNITEESRYPDRLDACDAPSEYRPGRLSDKEENNCNQNKA